MKRPALNPGDARHRDCGGMASRSFSRSLMTGTGVIVETRASIGVRRGADRWSRSLVLPAVLFLAGLHLAGCSPSVKVEPPDKPIEINLNVRIEQEVRIKIERELEEVFAENKDIF